MRVKELEGVTEKLRRESQQTRAEVRTRGFCGKDSKKSKVEPPHIGDGAPRDSNGHGRMYDGFGRVKQTSTANTS